MLGWSTSGGTLQEVYTYGPYGEPVVAAGATPNATSPSFTGFRFRYTGQTVLPEAQLYYYKARVYDPMMGRFLQTDPIGSEDDLNLYAYVGGDPINATDPTGMATYVRPDSQRKNKNKYNEEERAWNRNQGQAKKDISVIKAAREAYAKDPNSPAGRQFSDAMIGAFGDGALNDDFLAVFDQEVSALSEFYDNPNYVVTSADLSSSGRWATISNGKVVFDHSYYTSYDRDEVRMTTIHEPLHLVGTASRDMDEIINGAVYRVDGIAGAKGYARRTPRGAKRSTENWACALTRICSK